MYENYQKREKKEKQERRAGTGKQNGSYNPNRQLRVEDYVSTSRASDETSRERLYYYAWGSMSQVSTNDFSEN